MHNSFGNNFRIEVYGGSHDPVMGVKLEGVPAGLALSEADFEADIARRKPGAKGTTTRIEADQPYITEGLEQGKTTGGPLTIEFHNANTRPGDYSQFEAVPRPGHVDYVTHPARYGVQGAKEFPAFTGGGIFSGRVTLVIVAAGVVAKKMLALAYPGIEISATLVSVGGESDNSRWQGLIDKVVADGDSLGGVVECVAQGLPVGLGEPYFDSVESVVSHLVFSIPGVRGVEFGDGFAASAMRGSEHNDPFGPDGKPAKNGAGGVNGGLTNGAPLKFRVAFKPTATIHKAQHTYDFSRGEMTELSARGRHDACFALRTPVIVEAMTALALANLI